MTTSHAVKPSNFRRTLRALQWLVAGSSAERRRVRQELARISASLFGDFPLSDDYKYWRADKAFLDDYKRLSPGNPYSQDRKWTLREYVRLSNSLEGDLAECGCYQGATAYFMAQASSHGALCLFDSFAGISKPQDNDIAATTDVMAWNEGDLAASQATVRATLAAFEQVEYFPGWIPTRFDDVRDRRFRVVHIDVDLYQPTRDSIAFFYPRLVEGGVIVMDDYGLMTCPGARQAAEEYAAEQGIGILELPTGQGIITRRAI
jgi:O-methyltransferase